MDTTLNNKAAATINLRAKPLPPFADGKWVEIQIRVNAPNKQQQIAGYLAARHNHWQGDEQDSAFYDKVAADLAIPGFIDDVMKGAGDKNKKPKKPPLPRRQNARSCRKSDNRILRHRAKSAQNDTKAAHHLAV